MIAAYAVELHESGFFFLEASEKQEQGWISTVTFYKIEAMYERSRVNVKVERGSKPSVICHIFTWPFVIAQTHK